jgi:hypothetical protein
VSAWKHDFSSRFAHALTKHGHRLWQSDARLLWEQKVCYSGGNSLPWATLSQATPSYYIYLRCILISSHLCENFLSGLFASGFPHKCSISRLFHACHMPYLPLHYWYDDSYNIWWGVAIYYAVLSLLPSLDPSNTLLRRQFHVTRENSVLGRIREMTSWLRNFACCC